MKVLHVTLSVSPARGGPTEKVLNLVRALRQQGIEAEIATTTDNGAGQPPLDVPLEQRTDYAGCPIWFFPPSTVSLPGISLGRDRAFSFSAGLTRWLWQNCRHYDILDHHYLFSYPSTCAGIIARLHNIPYTMRTMGQLSPWALAQSRLKKQVYATLIERSNLNHAAGIHCTSWGEAEDVRAFGIHAPLITLPLGAHQLPPDRTAHQQLRQRYGIATNVPIVLFLSRLHYKKRPDLLLQSLATLKLQHPFHILLAGSGEPEYITYLQDLTRTLGLTEQVTFLGLITGADKALALQGSDFFVLPSHSENFGIAVAEAMLAGLPVIVTPEVQISPEVTAAQAGLVVPGTVEAVASAILLLLEQPDLRQQMGDRGQIYAQQNYTWDEIAQKLISHYQAILASRALPLDYLHET